MHHSTLENDNDGDGQASWKYVGAATQRPPTQASPEPPQSALIAHAPASVWTPVMLAMYTRTNLLTRVAVENRKTDA